MAIPVLHREFGHPLTIAEDNGHAYLFNSAPDAIHLGPILGPWSYSCR